MKTPRTIIDDDESHTTTTVLENPTEDEGDKREAEYDLEPPRYAPGANPQEGRRGGEVGADLVEVARLCPTTCEELGGATQRKVQAAVQASDVWIQAAGNRHQATHNFRTKDSYADFARAAGNDRDVHEIERDLEALRYDTLAALTLDAAGSEAQYPARRVARTNAKFVLGLPGRSKAGQRPPRTRAIEWQDDGKGNHADEVRRKIGEVTPDPVGDAIP